MKIEKLIILIILMMGFNLSNLCEINAQVNTKNSCLTCHEEEEIMPEDFSTEDVHLKFGLTCASCHGGDASSEDLELSMSERKGFIGIPEKNKIPNMCGKCHSDINYMRQYKPRIATDQVSQYYKSFHGKQLLKGDENVAECSSCHRAHNILPATDPRSSIYPMNIPLTCDKCHGDEDLMNEYNLESNQYEEYAEGVHGIALFEKKDISAPVCNDCHGNHGAAPPGLASVSNVCGTCHVKNLEYFKSSTMSKVFDKLHYHGCEQCHGEHRIIKPTDEMIGVSEESLCVNCHEEGDKGYKSAEIIYNKLINVNMLKDTAEMKLNIVEQLGMDDVEIKFTLQDLHQNIIQAKTLVHTFDTAIIDSHTQKGIALASAAKSKADSEIEEYYNRRNGLGIATLFLLLLAFAIYFKIKDNSKNKVAEDN